MPETPYRNVSWDRKKRKWQVAFHLRLFSEGKTLWLGRYTDDKEAARVGDAARRILDVVGKLDQRVDRRSEFDGEPPPSVTWAEILQRMHLQRIITPEEMALAIKKLALR
jgi:hypothetical protein